MSNSPMSDSLRSQPGEVAVITAMQSWLQGHIVSDDVSLRYFRSPSVPGAGLAKPPLVFVHGFTDCALYFARAAEAFAADWDVVAYDARGHGLSDRVGTSFDDGKRVADLLAVVTQLSLDRPALIGHSMGGSTIAKFAAEYPEHTRGVVLEDPAWFEPTDAELAASVEARAQRTAAWLGWIVDIQTKTRDEAIALRTNDEPLWDPVDIALSTDGRLQIDVAVFGPFLPAWSPWRERVAAFTSPALLLLGDRVDRGAIITEALATEASGLNPLLQWHLVSGAGHHVRYDQFPTYLDVVGKFLKGLH
jgi:N-formylmaleamate deformylase